MKAPAAPVLFGALAVTVLAAFAGLAALAAPAAGAIDPATAPIDFDLFLPLLLLSGIPGLLVAGLLPRFPYRWVPLWAIVGVGVAARLVFFAPEPFLSDDVFRYLWDGRVQLAGYSPYGVPPIDLFMADVEGDWPPEEHVGPRVNHPDIPTIYPPGLELIFWGAAALGGSEGR